MNTQPDPRHPSVDYEKVDPDYFQRRQLRRGAAGWVLLAGLGVAYVISGDFAGWNFGLAQGGWGGLLLATLLMAIMYSCMTLAMAEMASMIPATGGGYGFARRAFGPWGGFLTGTAILLEYAIAPAAIAVFIGGYVEGLFGWGGWPVYLAAYGIFVGIHLWGVGEAMKILFGVTLVAVIALLVFIVGMLPHFRWANLFDIPPTEVPGANRFLPFGWMGVWAAIPYAIWFFLAIEGVPLAAEETADPERNLPKGLLAGMAILLVFAALILTVGPGGAGARALMDSDDPLQAAIQSEAAYGGPNALSRWVGFVGLAGLIASFFSIVFAYSRQVFALSRAGYLPRWLSLTTRRRTPHWALLIPGALGFTLSLSGQGDRLILMAVFGATVSYALMMASHMRLRRREPHLRRPFRTPGGAWTSGVALILALVACVAGLLVDPWVIAGAGLFYALLLAWFALYSRHHLVAQAPEEEFEALKSAQRDLETR
jgi:ethanolamine permease